MLNRTALFAAAIGGLVLIGCEDKKADTVTPPPAVERAAEDAGKTAEKNADRMKENADDMAETMKDNKKAGADQMKDVAEETSDAAKAANDEAKGIFEKAKDLIEDAKFEEAEPHIKRLEAMDNALAKSLAGQARTMIETAKKAGAGAKDAMNNMMGK